MSVAQMRDILKNMYDRPNWSDKVDLMPDAQVFAIYNRNLNRKN